MTTAGTTQFFSTKLVLGEDHLWLDGNQKISGQSGFANAFSLVQISDCPNATSICKKSCYVHSIERYKPEVHQRYVHNSKTIRLMLNYETEYDAREWAILFATYIDVECREYKVDFRWHVSGDVFSEQYARWIRYVCDCSSVRHWIYTRSFQFVPILLTTRHKQNNLTVNLSCDEENYEEAVACHEKHPNTRLCYLATSERVPELPRGSVIFPDYHLRLGHRRLPELSDMIPWYDKLPSAQKAMVCPVDMWGLNEKRRCGPCDRCIKEPEASL